MPGAIVRFVEYVKINPETTAAKVEIIYTRKGSPPAKFVVLPYDWLVPRPEIQSIEDASGYIDKADIAVKK